MRRNLGPFVFVDMLASGCASSEPTSEPETGYHFHRRLVVGFPQGEKARLEERPTPCLEENKMKTSMLTLAVTSPGGRGVRIDARGENAM